MRPRRASLRHAYGWRGRLLAYDLLPMNRVPLPTNHVSLRLLAAAMLLALATRAAAAPAIDYAREERWAQEVVPSLVVGDAVYLATPERSKVLAVLTVPSAVSKGGVVVVHGLGVHPDFGMVNA